MITRDTVIRYAGNVENNSISIATKCCGGFSVESGVGDGDLIAEVRSKAPGPMNIPARITYVIPREGVYSLVFIRRPD